MNTTKAMKTSKHLMPNKGAATKALRISVLAAIVALGACASLPPNPQLEALQARFEMMSGQPFASQEAQSELDETREALNLARLAYADREDEALAHYLFVADKSLDIAEARVRLNATNTQIAAATTTRETMLREAREQEVARAEANARNAQANARAAQSEADRRAVALSVQQQQLANREAEIREQARELDAKDAELASTEAQLRAMERQAQLLADQLVEVTMVVNERGTVLVLSDIMFDFDSAALKPGSEHALNEVAAFLVLQETTQLKVEGHTDSRGTHDYNITLSEDRAEAVRNALVSRDVAPSRISIAGYGEDYPVASNDTDAGRQLNRRVEIVLNDKTGGPISSR